MYKNWGRPGIGPGQGESPPMRGDTVGTNAHNRSSETNGGGPHLDQIFLKASLCRIFWEDQKIYGGVLKVLVKKGPLGIHFLKSGS